MVKNVPRTRVHAQQHPRVPTPQKITTPQKKDDIFSVYNESIEKYFSVAKKTTATYLQSVTDLQEQIIDSWKKKRGFSNYTPTRICTQIKNECRCT